MFNWNNFERNVFTLEDQEKIARAVESGHANRIAQIVAIDDTVKEYWIAKIVRAYTTHKEPAAITGHEELVKLEKEGVQMTPELEAELEAKVQAERDLKKAQLDETRLKEEESLQKTIEVQVEKRKSKKGKTE